MEYFEIVKSALQALKANKLRTSLTMVGIVIGITSVILIYSIGQGAVAFITNELASFGTDYFQINPGKSQISTLAGAQSLTMDDYNAIRNDTSITNIKDVAPIALSSVPAAANGEEEELLVYGTTAEIASVLRPDIKEGEFLTEEQETSAESVVVMGIDAAEKFFGKNSSPLDETLTIDNKTYRVTGVVSSSSVLAGGFLNNALFIPISVASQNLTGNDSLMEIDVSVHDQNGLNQTITDVEALLRDQHSLQEGVENDFQIQSAQDILTTTQTITSLLTVMVAAISGISLVVGGVGVMNIMLVSVTERTKEIGLLKAIGAKDSDILTQFVFESMVMTMIGGIMGITLGIGCAYLVSLVAKIPFIVSIPAIVVAVGVSTAVGVIFGWYPARRAASLSPIEALQYQ
ncbi:FtsX-like permease family protein [Candidatus Roizmanbacteria bacterium]|nr:FtsX-like permease family protein [Candidatus Roizmanbacteria bacterium]